MSYGYTYKDDFAINLQGSQNQLFRPTKPCAERIHSMNISDLRQNCNRLSTVHFQPVFKGLGLTLCGLLMTGCNPGLIKMDSAVESDVTASIDTNKYKIVPNPKIDSGYLSVEAEYMEPHNSGLPDELKNKVGRSLSSMCVSGLKYDDKELSSVVSLKIGANGAIDNKSIPVSGFTLRRSGSDCEIAGELKHVTNAYPIELEAVQVHYGLRSSSGAEVPIKDIQAAIRVVGPAVSPGTLVYRVATDTVLQSIGETANENLKRRLRSELSESKSLTVYPLSKSQTFFIPLQFQREEESTLVGFIRIKTSLNPSVFTKSTTNGYPDYSKAAVKSLLSQNTNSNETLTYFVLQEKNYINSNQGMNVISLNQSCEKIAAVLTDDFALARSDRAFVLNKILSAHAKYNKLPPDVSKPEGERMEVLKDLKSFTDLECLSGYRDIFDEPAYGLDSKLVVYNRDVELINNSTIFNRVSTDGSML